MAPAPQRRLVLPTKRLGLSTLSCPCSGSRFAPVFSQVVLVPCPCAVRRNAVPLATHESQLQAPKAKHPRPASSRRRNRNCRAWDLYLGVRGGPLGARIAAWLAGLTRCQSRVRLLDCQSRRSSGGNGTATHSTTCPAVPPPARREESNNTHVSCDACRPQSRAWPPLSRFAVSAHCVTGFLSACEAALGRTLAALSPSPMVACREPAVPPLSWLRWKHALVMLACSAVLALVACHGHSAPALRTIASFERHQARALHRVSDGPSKGGFLDQHAGQDLAGARWVSVARLAGNAVDLSPWGLDGTVKDEASLWTYDASLGELLTAATRHGRFFEVLPYLDRNSSSGRRAWRPGHATSSSGLWLPVGDSSDA